MIAMSSIFPLEQVEVLCKDWAGNQRLNAHLINLRRESHMGEHAFGKQTESAELIEKLEVCNKLCSTLKDLLDELGKKSVQEAVEDDRGKRGKTEEEINADIEAIMRGGAGIVGATYRISGNDLLEKMSLGKTTGKHLDLACEYFQKIMERLVVLGGCTVGFSIIMRRIGNYIKRNEKPSSKRVGAILRMSESKPQVSAPEGIEKLGSPACKGITAMELACEICPDTEDAKALKKQWDGRKNFYPRPIGKKAVRGGSAYLYSKKDLLQKALEACDIRRSELSRIYKNLGLKCKDPAGVGEVSEK